MYAEELPPELVTDLNVVFRNTKHLSAMVNDVLDLSQTESGAAHTAQGSRPPVSHRRGHPGPRPLIDKKGLRLS